MAVGPKQDSQKNETIGVEKNLGKGEEQRGETAFKRTERMGGGTPLGAMCTEKGKLELRRFQAKKKKKTGTERGVKGAGGEGRI